ncbi:DUF3732 domain-containing protein [Variovorax sp. 770b2]|uniref:DUF3732 domain-containing protein n=1 Tax=Variovorax sp. 770b2 TaxID=1566271 RepID=UPI0008EFCC10|nr:DUF3732 domain-containing protein [Variovorax sp. 770b2]SFQ23851.1 Protein of unknown function [Variovorax sp. 770b2]
MYFQIRKVILWPRSEGLDPRLVHFEAGKVNVISGASKTGKSAVIPIIDYCLGSDRCGIPVGVIRESCAWFGIVIDTIEGQKLLARREPGDAQSTGEMFLAEADFVEIPHRIDNKNTNVDIVKSALNRLAGLPNLSFEPGTDIGYKSRPSFRDLMAFTFQPQNIVANPDVMFFKADTTEHREKLKTIFPYVLGTVTAEILEAKHQIDHLFRLLKRKEADLRALDAAGSAWQREGQAWIRQAIEYGLLPSGHLIPFDWSGIVENLRQIARVDPKSALPTLEGFDTVLERLAILRAEETNLSIKLSEHRQRLQELRRLEESSDEYGSAMRVQRDRLSLSTWIRELSEVEQDPVFALTGSAREQIAHLCEALNGIEVQLRSHPVMNETVGRETIRQRQATQSVLDELNGVRGETRLLEIQSKQVQDAAASQDRLDRFLGRLEEALRLYDKADQSGELITEVKVLRDQIAELQRAIAEHETARKLRNALERVENFAGKLIPLLDGEWPNDPIKLIINDLTIKVIRGAKDVYLWEVGSGANWLAYHIAITTALQRYFLEVPHHPVPGLLIYDQPSQVYFPVKRVVRENEPAEDLDWRMEDVAAVRKVFTLLDAEVHFAQGRLQVIVLDHADEEVWGGLPNVHAVEEWRGKAKALVPPAWLDSGS